MNKIIAVIAGLAVVLIASLFIHSKPVQSHAGNGPYLDSYKVKQFEKGFKNE